MAVITAATRFNVVCCGRRWGKTTLGIDRLITPETLHHPLGWWSPTYKMLLEVWRDMVRILKPVTARKNTTERRIELITGGVVEMWSMDNPDSARGRHYRRIVVDEAALVPYLTDGWQQAIRPTLIDLEGDAWFLSTPKGHNGFWQLYNLGLDRNQPDWNSWQMPTSSNPHVPPGEIEAMRHSMPAQVFAQEVMAEFVEDAGGVFRRVLEAATAPEQDEREPGHEYVFGVDWAQSNDFTVIAVVDTTLRQLVYMDRFNQIEYAIQRGRLRALAERFRPHAVYSEVNAMGQPITEQLQREGLPVVPFQTTNATKAAAIDALALAFERADIKIINDPVLISELQAYEMGKTKTGLRTFSAPDGMHDDTVMALALAWQAVAQAVRVLW